MQEHHTECRDRFKEREAAAEAALAKKRQEKARLAKERDAAKQASITGME